MNDEMREAVAKQLPIMYPELFDDPNASAIVDSLITQAYMVCQQYTDNDDELSTLVRLYTAHLLYTNQSAGGTATSIKADVFQINMSDNTANGDIYLPQFMDVLQILGANDWGVQFL
ncbi:hypothetical protein [Lentilactobacillus sp. SPB1-3]|uniref:Uncharacterized protein n=1 Tax=Lentilactobacillus terminaliae TaxID=3003483 RepID=A0ACD5DDW1_9LACO|nr:hypothetical protein [Lentilactobacillus sp. SPB1-3]MCZ0978038.1 hypothetical protein [Lentilactobacillus sp. SPB1-3]